MRVLATLAFLSTASAFLPQAPLGLPQRAPVRRAARVQMLSGDFLDATSNLLAIVKENDVFVKNAGEYSWGSVTAPEWALPVAAFATLSFGVVVPLFLRDGVDAFNKGENAGRVNTGATRVAAKPPGPGKAPVPVKGGAKPAAKAAPAKPAAKAPVAAKPQALRPSELLKAKAAPAKPTPAKPAAKPVAKPAPVKPAAKAAPAKAALAKPAVKAAGGKAPLNAAPKAAVRKWW